jgi:hypothetical protein
LKQAASPFAFHTGSLYNICIQLAPFFVVVKLIFVIVTLVGLFVASFHDCMVILTFTLNRAYIATHLCEQRTTPGNSCQGCCQLRKQLNNEQRKEPSSLPLDQKDHTDFQLLLVGNTFNSFFSSDRIYPAPPQHLRADPLCCSIFHPPNPPVLLTSRLHYS